MSPEIVAGFILFGIFFFLLFIGFPIAFGIAISSIIALIYYVDLDFAVKAAAQGFATGVDSFTFLAIPLFVIAGNIMNKGSIAERLINFTKAIAAPLPGVLAHCNILANTLFGALAGIASAAAIAVGGTINPHAQKEKYDKGFMAAVNAASAPSGLIIPPSASLILFSLYSGGTSIAALFVAGYLPGLLWCLACLGPAIYFTVKHKYPRGQYPSIREFFLIAFRALPPIMLILLIIGGIIKGWFTPTEAAGMAVLFSFILTLIYRELGFKDLPKILLDSVVPSAICTFLVAASGVMGWALNYTSIPEMISQFIISLSDNKFIILISINLMLLMIGTFLDLTPALIIFTPILMPIFNALGMDPVHVGIMMVFNLSIGLITPPVGTLLFVSCSIADIPFQKIIKPIMPMIIMLVLTLFIIVFVPEITLFVPRLLGLL